MWKYGSIVSYRQGKITRMEHEDYKSGLSIVKNVLNAIQVPWTELDVSDEYMIPSVLQLNNGRINEYRLPSNNFKYWLGFSLQRGNIELPGTYITSNIAKNRYINLEIITEARKGLPNSLIISQWTAVRQCLRGIARTMIEEKIIAHYGNVNYKLREYILKRVFPDEEGDEEPNEWKWIEAFIRLRRMVIR